jgi:hypothetical protein
MNIVAASLCSTLRAPYLTVEQLEEPSLFREQVEISKVVCFSMDLCLFPCGVGEDLAEEIAEFILVILILGVDLYAELRNGQICLFLPLHNPNIIEYRRLQTILSSIHFLVANSSLTFICFGITYPLILPFSAYPLCFFQR